MSLLRHQILSPSNAANASGCTTLYYRPPLYIAARPRIANFARHSPPFSPALVFILTSLPYLPFRIVAIFFHGSPLSAVQSLLLLQSFSVISIVGCSFIVFSTPASSVCLGTSLMRSIPERPGTLRSGFARHPHGDIEVLSALFSVLTVVIKPPVQRITASCLGMEPRHLSSTTAAPFNAGVFAANPSASLDSYLAMTRAPDVQHSCSAVVWDESRRFDVESHVRSMFQTAAGRFLHLAP